MGGRIQKPGFNAKVTFILGIQLKCRPVGQVYAALRYTLKSAESRGPGTSPQSQPSAEWPGLAG